RLDRLSRILHGEDLPIKLEEDVSLPLRKKQSQALWSWLGERYWYESRDWAGIGDTEAKDFYFDTARAYLARGDAMPRHTPEVTFSPESGETPKVRVGHATAYNLQVRRGQDDGTLPGEVFERADTPCDDRWFMVEEKKGPDENGAAPLKLTIQLTAAAEKN